VLHGHLLSQGLREVEGFGTQGHIRADIAAYCGEVMSTLTESYSLKWPSGTDQLRVEMWMIKHEGKHTKKDGSVVGKGLPFHYEAMRKLLWPELEDHRWNSLCRDEILKNKVTVLMGPGSCLLGSTKILNPITGAEPTIQELCESGIAPMVMTLHGPKMAGVPYVKGYEELYEVVLDDGSKFTSTPNHRVLSVDGFCRVDSLQIGQSLFSYAPILPWSTLGSGPSTHGQGAQNSQKTIEGSKSRCSAYFCHDDARLLEARVAAQERTPSHAGAREHIRDGLLMDFQACGEARNRFYPKSFHPSTCSASPSERRQETPDQLHALSGIASHASCLYQSPSQFQRTRLLRSPFVLQAPCFSSTPNAFGNQIWRISNPYSSAHFSPLRVQSQIPYRPEPGRDRLEMIEGVKCSAHIGGSNNGVLASTCLTVSTARVVSITSAGKHTHYDIQVPDVHHYFAQGTIHHNSGKTHTAAWVHLCEYFCYPEETCVLVSSTDMRGLKMRVWGEIASLWSRAIEKYDYLPGHMLDSACAITTDSLEDDEGNRNIRDFRKGVVGIPTMQGGRFVGLQKWVGIKQKRVRLIADEAAMMGAGFLSAFSNLNKNSDFRAVVLGNPNDPTDCLGRCAEPLDGWESHMNPDKTCTWKTRFMNGVCVNLIGTDSPNFDYPDSAPTKYKYLINRQKISETVSFFGKDSYEYFSQCVGSMRIGQLARRVLTRSLCEQNGAMICDVNWVNGSRTRVAGLDSAYNGDRCVFYWAEFGKIVGGKTILFLHQPLVVPIAVGGGEPEQQISEFCKRECESHGIPPENFAHDSGTWKLGNIPSSCLVSSDKPD